jgi:hypothetical protein
LEEKPNKPKTMVERENAERNDKISGSARKTRKKWEEGGEEGS